MSNRSRVSRRRPSRTPTNSLLDLALKGIIYASVRIEPNHPAVVAEEVLPTPQEAKAACHAAIAAFNPKNADSYDLMSAARHKLNQARVRSLKDAADCKARGDMNSARRHMAAAEELGGIIVKADPRQVLGEAIGYLKMLQARKPKKKAI